MPEFYQGSLCRYQPAAQPYLDAIARAVRDIDSVRNYLLIGTEFAQSYVDAVPLWHEQWRLRDPGNSMSCPFWSNYWYEPCKNCNCRIDKSVSMEIDALFFLKNSMGRKIAIHIEMKREREKLSHGQAEAYRPRANCYQEQRRVRPAVLSHNDFVTILFCGQDSDLPVANRYFDRVILHKDARKEIKSYPFG